MRSLLAALACASTAWAAARTSAPAGCITVGPNSTFNTIQKAVESLSTTEKGSQCIFISPGTYKEQVLVSAREAKLTMYGSTTDTSSYGANQVSITASRSQDDGLNNDETATLRVKAAGFKLYNVNVANTRGRGSQAIALSAFADSGYYGCALTGYQDTLLAEVGKQLYSRCLIQGATDFIFGQHATAWFSRCQISLLAAATGYITANGRDSASNPSYYAFDHCTIAAAAGNHVSDGAYFLGRPWREWARVTFQSTEMSAAVSPAGWSVWSKAEDRTAHVSFAEASNTGPAAATSSRARFSSQLPGPVAISEVLGAGYDSADWYDKAYM